MLKIKEFINEVHAHKIIYILLGIFIIVGIFLRTYHFSSLMHFELDQARDVFVIHDAISGEGHLPLLGPQARGRELYLGPIFYYFQYISGLFFGVSPESAALPDLAFSLLAIPLFFLFVRLFFNRVISVSLTALVAVSLFLVIYGRFAWNPNAMFFWSLVTFYGLLKSWRLDTFNAKWFAVAVIGLGVVTQLHFIAYIVAPLTFLLYLISARVRVPWKMIVLSLLALGALYAPVIISDVKNNGQNIRMFLASVTLSPEAEAEANTASDKEHDLIEKVFRAGQESGTFYWNVLSSDNHGRYNIRTKKQEQGYFPLICDDKCKNALPYHIAALSLLFISLGIFFLRFCGSWSRVRRKASVKNIDQRNNYLLIVLWLFFSGVFLVMVAYQISPRFYLFLAVPFFVIFGVILEMLYNIRRFGLWMCVIFSSVFLLANIVMSVQYFDVLHAAQSDIVQWRDISMNRNSIVTLGQLRRASEYIDNDQVIKPFVIVGDNRYARALYYFVDIENRNKSVLCYVKRGGFQPELVQGMPYYLLVKSGSKNHITDGMRQFHAVTDQQKIGTIMLYKMVPYTFLNESNVLPEKCFTR